METEAVFNGTCGNENKTGLNHAINGYRFFSQMSISSYSNVNANDTFFETGTALTATGKRGKITSLNLFNFSNKLRKFEFQI